MAGPAKVRTASQKQQQQQQTAGSSGDSSSRDPTQRSINRFDGNRDPHGHGAGVMDYTRPNDLKNLSEFLGMAGWYTARGVSENVPVTICACIPARNCLLCILIMRASSAPACQFCLPWTHDRTSLLPYLSWLHHQTPRCVRDFQHLQALLATSQVVIV